MRIRRCTPLHMGLLVLMMLAQAAQSDQPETPADCNDIRTRTGCRTIWEILLCSPNNAYSAVADAARRSGVNLASVLDNPDTSLTLTVVNNSVFDKMGFWPGADIAPGRPAMPGSNNTDANGNPFDPVSAQLWFYYNLLPGDYSPSDLLSVNSTVRTALYYGYQNATQTLGIANDTTLSNPGFLAYNYTGVWPENMTMTEGTTYPAGNSPVAARVLAFETACNGHVYLMNNTMMRVMQPGGGLQPSPGQSLYSGFTLPMSSVSMFNYEPMCNETTVNDVLTLASINAINSASRGPPRANPNATADLYMAFAVDDETLMQRGGSRDLSNMSFTMIGVDDPFVQIDIANNNALGTLRMLTWLLYTMLPGAYCPDDLVSMGQINTLLGAVMNQWLPLNFTRNGTNILSPVVITTPDGFVIGTITSVYTFCRSVFLGTSQVSRQDPFRMTVDTVPNLRLPNVSLRGPIELPPGGKDFTADDVWEGVTRQTWALKRTPGSCSNPIPPLDDMAGIGLTSSGIGRHSPTQPVAMPPAPAPAPPPSSNEARTIAIAVPVSIAIAIFCLGVFAGTLWMYRRQKRLKVAATKDTEHGLGMGSRTSKGVLPDGSGFSDGMLDDSLAPAKPVPMSATIASVETKSSDDGNGTPSTAPDGTPLDPAGPSCGLSSSRGEGDAGLASSVIMREVLDSLEPSWVIDADQLQLIRKIGQGSFGEVFAGKWRSSAVAVKRLPDYLQDDPDDARRFSSSMRALQKEVAIMAGLRHPAVVQFLGVSLDPPMLVTEYCERGSLFNVVYNMRFAAPEAISTGFDWRRRLSLALDAALGMEFLHSRGIIHRDLKSPNLLVDRSWHVKVADFGLSKLMDTSKSRSSLVVMNPKWLSPEIIRNEPHSKSSDVYSFGVVLWELMMLKEPFEDMANPIQIAFAVANNGARPYRESDMEAIPGGGFDGLHEYITLMHDCWHQQPSERPSFEAIAQRLRVLRRGAGSRQGSTNGLPTRTSTSSAEGRRSNDVSFSTPSDDALKTLPSLNDMLGAQGGNSSGQGGAMADPAAMAPVKFSLQPTDPQRLFSGAASSDGDVADALSVVQSTAAAAAAVELTLSQDDARSSSIERGWQPQLGGLPEGEKSAEGGDEPRKPKKGWSKLLKGRGP